MKRHYKSNLTNANLFAICRYLDNWTPKTEAEQRDKEILTLHYEHDYSASKLASMKRFRSLSNRALGSPMSQESICRIIKGYAQEWPDKKHQHHYSDRDRQLGRLRRSGYYNGIPKVCRQCGATSDLHLHHIVPRSSGGSDAIDNMTYLCADCHRALHGNISGALVRKVVAHE